MKYLNKIIAIDGHDKRKRKNSWVGIVLHHTGIGKKKSRTEKMWRTFNMNVARYLGLRDKVYVSAHYQIGRYGEIIRIIDDEKYIAFHAGKSSFWHPIKRKWVNNCNEYYIGVELLGDGNQIRYTETQYEALSELCAYLMDRHVTIQPNLIVGHEMVSPGRKVDVGKFFAWGKFHKMLHKKRNEYIF